MFRINNSEKSIQKPINRIPVLGIFRIRLFERIDKNKKILPANLNSFLIHKKITLKMEIRPKY